MNPSSYLSSFFSGTRAVLDLCIQNNVKRLVYSSCTSVCFLPFKGRSTFSAIINSTESKTDTPVLDSSKLWEQDGEFLIPGYASSKLRAENIVLNSNGAPLQNQLGKQREAFLYKIPLCNPLIINPLRLPGHQRHTRSPYLWRMRFTLCHRCL